MKKQITDENFAGFLGQGKPLVVDFGATWCGPCGRIAPYFDQMADEYEGRAIVGSCDVDENSELTQRFGIRNVPTVLYFDKDGNLKDKMVGAAPKSTFTGKLDALL